MPSSATVESPAYQARRAAALVGAAVFNVLTFTGAMALVLRAARGLDVTSTWSSRAVMGLIVACLLTAGAVFWLCLRTRARTFTAAVAAAEVGLIGLVLMSVSYGSWDTCMRTDRPAWAIALDDVDSEWWAGRFECTFSDADTSTVVHTHVPVLATLAGRL
jgi:hypothetical protein